MEALVLSAEYALLDDDFEACLAICARAMSAYPRKLRPYLIASRAAHEVGRSTGGNGVFAAGA